MSLPRQPQLPPAGVFRPAVYDDVDALLPIYLRFPAALNPHVLHGREWLESMVEDGAQVVLSPMTREVVGMVAVWRDRQVARADVAAVTLFLHPDFQLNGRGRQMLDRAVQMARYANFATLRAYVYRSNDASYQFFLRVIGPPKRMVRGQYWDGQYVFAMELR